MGILNLYSIWRRFRNQLISIIVRFGTKRKINWGEELKKVLNLVQAVREERATVPIDTSDSDPAPTTGSPATPSKTKDEKKSERAAKKAARDAKWAKWSRFPKRPRK